mmetsp:Transcript_80397/g.172085  ORF Transcript_80397/g.172085 Transcript_80397/m.172085 type:complete len:383 (-) Transcript_80397:86-1234(-)
MPRGPGKKDNYNLDYSRFNCFDQDEEEVKAKPEPAPPAQEQAGGEAADMSDFRDMLRNMPPELQEAYRMMQIARESGDPEAQKRANELALSAVQKGGPEVQQGFVREIARQAPEASKLLNDGQLSPEEALKALEKASLEPPKPAEPEDISCRIDDLRKKMEKGKEDTRRQLEELQKQQEQMERLQSPEDFFKFMQQEGMNEQDLQRMFSGDEKHMESCLKGMLDKAVAPDPKSKLVNPDLAVSAAEELHAAICGGEAPPPPGQAIAETSAAPAPPKEAVRKSEEPPKEEVIIPDHRLQYQKDADGRFVSVELKCTLPGVSDMSMIALDVADRHVRLTTCKPAPRYCVNAGPFPVLIDAGAARAKYSKKREELSITVPAKMEN